MTEETLNGGRSVLIVYPEVKALLQYLLDETLEFIRYTLGCSR